MPRRRKVAGRVRSGSARSRSRCASRASRWHWPACCAQRRCEIPCDRAWSLRTQARFDVAQALAIGQLGEGHAEVLVETREPLDLVLAGSALRIGETVQRQMLHHLRENELAQVHRLPPARGLPAGWPGTATAARFKSTTRRTFAFAMHFQWLIVIAAFNVGTLLKNMYLESAIFRMALDPNLLIVFFARLRCS